MAHPVAGIGGLAPDVCTGLSAGVLLWDSLREHTMSCDALRSREETKDSERSVERRRKEDGFVTAMPLHMGQRLVSTEVQSSTHLCESRPRVMCIVSLIHIPLHVPQKTAALLILPLLWSGQREVLCCAVQDLVLCESVYVCLCRADHSV